MNAKQESTTQLTRTTYNRRPHRPPPPPPPPPPPRLWSRLEVDRFEEEEPPPRCLPLPLRLPAPLLPLLLEAEPADAEKAAGASISAVGGSSAGKVPPPPTAGGSWVCVRVVGGVSPRLRCLSPLATHYTPLSTGTLQIFDL